MLGKVRRGLRALFIDPAQIPCIAHARGEPGLKHGLRHRVDPRAAHIRLHRQHARALARVVEHVVPTRLADREFDRLALSVRDLACAPRQFTRLARHAHRAVAGEPHALAHKLLHSPEEDEAEVARLLEAAADEKIDLVAFEKNKIKGAIRTDFILSAEIIVLTLGTVAGREFSVQIGVLVAIAALMTVGVYGLVAGIVKLDDAGLHLSKRPGSGSIRAFGRGILYSAPWLMKFLSVAGTAAMFLVGGGIFTHSIPFLHDLAEAAIPEGALGMPVTLVVDAVVGILVGIIVVAAITAWGKLRGKPAAH